MRKQIIGSAAIQGSPEWLELRKDYRTASEASVVMGFSPFQKPEDLKLIKAGLKTVFYSKAMKQGNDLEHEVLKLAEEHFNDTFETQIWTNEMYLASLDGINFKGDTLVELKVSEKTFNDISKGIIPKHYQIQVLQQMYCSGAVNGYLVAMNPKTKEIAVTARIGFEDKFMDELNSSWIAFDYMDIPIIKETVDFTDNNHWGSIENDLIDIQGQIKILKEKEMKAKDKLINMANGKNGKGLFCSVYYKKGSVTVDRKTALIKLVPDADLTEFTSTGSPTWAIRVKRDD